MKISICMATYNGERYIFEQLKSILKQISKYDEIIISDDSSNDETADIIKLFKDDRIILIENQKFNNPIFNFENSIINSSGDIIVLSDQDDIWESNKIEVVRQSFANRDMDKPVLNVYNGVVIDESDNIIYDDLFIFLKIKKRLTNNILNNIVKNKIIGCNIAFNRTLLNFALPFPKNVPMHDMWLGNIAYLFGEVSFINRKIIKYRRHSNNYTNYKTTMKQKFTMRYYLVKNLFIRYRQHSGKNKTNV